MADGKPGRPRQPYCLDCKRAGRPEVLKKPGYGYCAEHVNLRMRSYKRAAQEDIDVTDAREKELLDTIEDLRSQVKYYKDEYEQQKGTIANLLNPIQESGSTDYPYLHPYADEEDEEARVDWEAAFFDLRDWAIPVAEKHGEELPPNMRVYKTLTQE